MGISDEEYAKALKLQQAYAVQQMKKELDKQKEKEMAISTSTSLGGLLSGLGQQQSQGQSAYQNAAAQQAAYPTGVTGITTTATNAVWANAPTGINGITTLNEKDLKHDAMTAPLSALVDMWTMRWQGEWVSETEFQEDDFWRLALIRLTGANKLEKHHLASSYYAVYRIIE